MRRETPGIGPVAGATSGAQPEPGRDRRASRPPQPLERGASDLGTRSAAPPARFSLATNFDDSLPARVAPHGVFELYGKLPADCVGGGRATFMLASTSRRAFRRHVAACRGAGLGFNYLLNSGCLDNLEYTRSGQRRIRQLLDWLGDAGISSVTVANPFLLRMVKASYPSFETRVSVFAAVDDVRRVRSWEDLGADRITLDSLQINRDFEVLQAIRAAVVRCRLELLASNSCIQNCPLQPYHPNLLAHASQSGHRSRGYAIDWCILWCSCEKLREPANFLRADWIRPEDLAHYEALGFHEFKLTERNAPTDVLVLRAQAYGSRRYDGNLLDLVQPYAFPAAPAKWQRRGAWWFLSHFLRRESPRWRQLQLLYQLARLRGFLAPVGAPVYVDNRALDGFIDRFLEQGCRHLDCETCRYCHAWSENSVTIDAAWRRECLRLYDTLFQQMESGAMW